MINILASNHVLVFVLIGGGGGRTMVRGEELWVPLFQGNKSMLIRCSVWSISDKTIAGNNGCGEF